MRNLFILTMSVLLLSSCLTQKKREDVTYRYLREHPKVLADLSSLHFPVSGKPGEVIVKRDTAYVIETDTLRQDSIIFVRRDSVSIIREYHNRVDTVTDNATLQSLRLEIAELNKMVTRMMTEQEMLSNRSRQRLYWIIGLSAALLIIIVVGVTRLFKLK